MSAALHIQLEDAGKRYNRDWIFKNCTLELPPHSLLAITGANGSGKSTLLQCLGGFQGLSTGKRTYLLNNCVIPEILLYQHLSLATPYLELPEAYTLNEIISFHFKLKPQRKNFDLSGWIESAGLAAHRQKQLMHYSSGMKQRVKLLLAFAGSSSVLLLDEPTTNLDEQGNLWYQQLVDESLTHFPRSLLVASNQIHEYRFCTQILSVSDFKQGAKSV
jgi:ABC-type multidrug transport system ATPase subunit